MKKRIIKLLALLLCGAVLLSGCGGVDVTGFFNALGSATGVANGGGGSLKEALSRSQITPYSEMEYTRPDMDALQALQEKVQQAAAEENLDGFLNGIYELYDAYDRFYTAYSLADIRYSGDLTSRYWEEEYRFCGAASSRVDSMLEELYRALAESPLVSTLEGEDLFGPGFFDDYRGESVYSDEFLALLEEESALVSRYYQLSGEADPGEGYDAWWNDTAQVLVDLIRVRQQQAACQGYDSFVDFAYDFYYDRDYTPAEAEAYLDGIRESLIPLYRESASSDAWAEAGRYASEKETFAYLRTSAENMGGTVLDAFRLMERGGLYDISYGENKYNASFEVYLTSYGEPFLFMNPELTRYDSLTIAHEFGHFCNDYASFGSTVGVDVAEFFSQGMEYLSLCYGENTAGLARAKLADSLSTYVEQGCYAAFEQEMYGLTGEALSPEGLLELYEQTTLAFGFDSVGYDARELVFITHFYTNPMYVISYVVSNDAAMQLYELERSDPGAGLSRLEEHLSTEESFFLAFLESAGLESPFGRLPAVKALFEAEL